MIDRRGLLKAVPAGVVGGIGAQALATGGGRRLKTGVQLFSLIREIEKDMAGTLQAVARVGFREVETLGALGIEPLALRRMLDRCGLVTTSQNLSPGGLYKDFADLFADRIGWDVAGARWTKAFDLTTLVPTIEEGIARARILGQTDIVWQFGWQPEYGIEVADRYAAAFNEAGRLCARAGMRFSFHNHEKEFFPVSGERPFDRILKRTESELVGVELDSYWAMRGGVDPIALLAEHRGRIRLAHIKDGTAAGPTALGKGNVDLGGFLRAAAATGVKTGFVEDEVSLSFDQLAQAYDYLQTL